MGACLSMAAAAPPPPRHAHLPPHVPVMVLPAGSILVMPRGLAPASDVDGAAAYVMAPTDAVVVAPPPSGNTPFMFVDAAASPGLPALRNGAKGAGARGDWT
jgi:hypothetical protein